MKIEITKPEQITLLEAIDKHEASVKRAINTIKSPEVKACYEKQLIELQPLKAKIMTEKLI